MSLLLRGVTLGLALFAAASIALSLAVASLARRFRLSRGSADGVFLIRMLPALAAAVLGLGLWAPAYWAFEPRQAEESLGWVALALAGLGLGLILSGAYRGLLAQAATARLVSRWQQQALPIATGALPAYAFPDTAPGVVLVGLLRPRVLVSQPILDRLTPAELLAVVAHEDAHRRAHDNWRRLAIAAAPDVLGLFGAGRGLEAAWARAAELAADRAAVGGRPERAIDLCSALVKVARLALPTPAPRPFGSFLHDGEELRERVQRLLDRPSRHAPRRRGRWLLVAPIAALATPEALRLIHSLGEELLRLGH